MFNFAALRVDSQSAGGAGCIRSTRVKAEGRIYSGCLAKWNTGAKHSDTNTGVDRRDKNTSVERSDRVDSRSAGEAGLRAEPAASGSARITAEARIYSGVERSDRNKASRGTP